MRSGIQTSLSNPNSTPEAYAAEFSSSVLVAVRTCLLAIVLFAASVYGVYIHQESWATISYFFPHLALLFGFCAVSGVWITWRRSSSLFACLQFVVDIGVVTGVVYATGGPISPLIFLYLALVMAAAILLSFKGAVGIAMLSLGAYGALLWGLSSGWIPMFQEGRSLELPRQGLVWQLAGLSLAMLLIALASSYLRRRIWADRKAAWQSSQDLSELHFRQRTLIEGVSDGVITTDPAGNVFSINQAACTILQISEKEALGRPLQNLCENIPGGSAKLLAEEGAVGPVEFQTNSITSAAPRKVVFSKRPISDSKDRSLGSVCIFQDVTKLRSAEEQLALQDRMAALLAGQHETPDRAPQDFHGFVGESVVMRKVFSLIERVAASEANVLICGESGTGKELAARAIHTGSHRRRGPFVAIDCGAVPESLIESLLFGHKKGSFTGADTDQTGLFKQAHGGTLFLDEIAELPLLMQAKLLRAIQEKTIRPIGAEREIVIDVRIIAATNKNLRQEVTGGRFREDLYYRLNVVGINLPPLRERKEDIPLLVNAILKHLIKTGGLPLVPPASLQILMNYDYPGNVRELENILERAVVLGGDAILPEHLPEYMYHQATLKDQSHPPGDLQETQILVNENLQLPVDLDTLLSTIERKYLEIALIKTNGVKKRAAELLGMNFRSFRYRLQKFGMSE